MPTVSGTQSSTRSAIVYDRAARSMCKARLGADQLRSDDILVTA
jgi:hypothetical protein